MKKALSLILCLVIVSLCLSSCGVQQIIDKFIPSESITEESTELVPIEPWGDYDEFSGFWPIGDAKTNKYDGTEYYEYMLEITVGDELEYNVTQYIPTSKATADGYVYKLLAFSGVIDPYDGKGTDYQSGDFFKAQMELSLIDGDKVLISPASGNAPAPFDEPITLATKLDKLPVYETEGTENYNIYTGIWHIGEKTENPYHGNVYYEYAIKITVEGNNAHFYLVQFAPVTNDGLDINGGLFACSGTIDLKTGTISDYRLGNFFSVYLDIALKNGKVIISTEGNNAPSMFKEVLVLNEKYTK